MLLLSRTNCSWKRWLRQKNSCRSRRKTFRDQFPMPSIEGFQLFQEVVFKAKDSLMERRFDNLTALREISQGAYDLQVQRAYQDLCMQSRQAAASIFEYLPRRNRNVREFLGIPGPDVPVVDTPEPTTRDLLAKIDQLMKTVASLQVKVSRGSSSQSRRDSRSKNAQPGGKKSNKKVSKPKNSQKSGQQSKKKQKKPSPSSGKSKKKSSAPRR